MDGRYNFVDRWLREYTLSKDINDSRVSVGRLVVKAGTNVLTGGTDRLDLDIMTSIVNQISELHKDGHQVLLVTSGAIAAGMQVLSDLNLAADLPFRQASAAVGQSRLMNTYEHLFGAQGITVAQALLSRVDIQDREGYLNVRNTLLALLSLKVIPIINENDVVAVEEIGVGVFGDNDNLSALVSNLVDADLLILLSDIGGLYTADPHVDANASLISLLDHIDEEIESFATVSHSSRGTGGMRAKLEAVKLANASGTEVVIANGLQDGTILRLIGGESVGTRFSASSNKIESRKRWMLSGISHNNYIVVDRGAAYALRHDKRSLLPAGISGVSGEFFRGDIVLILDPDGREVACGIVGYRSDEISLIKGLQSESIYNTLGHKYGEEIVHKDNLIVL